MRKLCCVRLLAISDGACWLGGWAAGWLKQALQCTGGQRTVVQRSEDRIQELLFEAVCKEHVDQDVNEPMKHAQAHCSHVLHSATPLEADATNPASACDRRIVTVACSNRVLITL